MAPGVYEFVVPPDEPVHVHLGSDRPDTPVEFASSEPVVPYEDDDEGSRLELGQEVRGAIEWWESFDTWELELEGGQRVDVLARSALGDVGVTVIEPGGTLEEGEFFDDGGGGVFDLDAEGAYEAPVSGRYRLVIESLDVFSMAYRLTVTEA